MFKRPATWEIDGRVGIDMLTSKRSIGGADGEPNVRPRSRRMGMCPQDTERVLATRYATQNSG